MRLYPPVTEQEALAWLKQAAAASWGVDMTPEVEGRLRGIAEAMAAISAVLIPEDVEPHFP